MRKNARYEHFGQVVCPELCPVGGALDNISIGGFRAHFAAPVALSFETDYEVRVRLSSFPTETLSLISHPVWSHEDKGVTTVGFSILRSPDSVRLESCIARLRQEQQELDDDGVSHEKENQCLFV